MSTPIDEAEVAGMMARAGLSLTPAQVSEIMPGVRAFRRMIDTVNAALPREAEPALTFNVEQR